MRSYEIAVIFKAAADETSVQGVLDRVTSSIETSGGKSDKVNRWGKKTFAYEIDHQTEGNYVLLDAQISPDKVAEPDRILYLADEVVRHKIIKKPEGNVKTSSVLVGMAPPRRERGDRDRDDRESRRDRGKR